MLKMWAIFAVLVSATPPLPRQTTARPSDSSGQPNSNSQGQNHVPGSPVPVVNPAQPPIDSEQAAEVSAQKAEHGVTLTSVPPITINDKKKTVLDYVYEWGPWFFGLFLAIAGGLQLKLLRVTWQAIKEQKSEAAIQTGILKQSADIGRGAAIPTLRMLKFNMSGSDPLVDNEMELTVRNYGATPAILDALYISFDDGERWPTAEGEPVAYDDRAGRAVAANSEGTLHCSPTMCLVSPRLIPRFRTELKRLYVHGRLKYLDVFDSPVRSLRFDVCLSPRQNGTIHCEIIGQRNEYEIPQKAN